MSEWQKEFFMKVGVRQQAYLYNTKKSQHLKLYMSIQYFNKNLARFRNIKYKTYLIKRLDLMLAPNE